MIADTDKLRCAQRELMRRKRVYTARVHTRRMSARDADREIAAMAAIVCDYERLAAKELLWDDHADPCR